MKRVGSSLAMMGLMLPAAAQAVPLADFIDTSFVGGGAMLFVAGLVMLFLPRFFRWGVTTLLLADGLFILRILWRKEVTDYLQNQTGYGPFIEEMSRDASRFYTLVGVAACLLAILVLRFIFHALFGQPALPARAEKDPKTGKWRHPVAAQPKGHPRVRPQQQLDADEDETEVYQSVASRPASGSKRGNRFRVHDYLEQLERQQQYREHNQ
jgi:Ca2+/Na+ antiporter